MPMSSSAGIAFGEKESAAQNDEEYARIFTGVAGSSVNLAVDALVDGIDESRDEHLEQFRGKTRKSPRTNLRATFA